MTVEEAIKTSIEYETRVRDVYAEAVNGVQSPEGKRLFQLMMDEEQLHVDYLEAKLDQRFLEIEEGHLALVQAQIDQATGSGYWFDVREFTLEG
ncbi:MAG: hypothetical protein ABIK85_07155 [Candidatus Eisenbacteria bacterium]